MSSLLEIEENKVVSPDVFQDQLGLLNLSFSNCLKKFKIGSRACKSEAVLMDQFLSLDDQTQMGLFRRLELSRELLIEIEKESQTPDLWEITVDQEIKFLRRALEAFNLKLSDESVLDRIKEGDIFEVYNSESIQIYRSWSLFEHTSYSLSDLLIYSWDELYDRPTFVRKYLYEMVDSLLVQKKKFHAYDIPAYFIVERMPEVKNKMLFQMEYAVATLDCRTKEPVGLLTTGKARNINTEISNGMHFI